MRRTGQCSGRPSSFTAIYLYGWRRLGGWAHFWTGVPIAVTGIGGAMSVVAVNSWMNQPGGFTASGGRIVAVNPWHVFSNHATPYEMPHMILAAYMVTGFFVAGVSRSIPGPITTQFVPAAHPEPAHHGPRTRRSNTARSDSETFKTRTRFGMRHYPTTAPNCLSCTRAAGGPEPGGGFLLGDLRQQVARRPRRVAY
jgi:hypothetical protein